MTAGPLITVLYGGIGPEREVSLVSGSEICRALSGRFPTRLVELREGALPDGLEPSHTVVFPALHGEFGEDGTLQKLLEDAGFAYAGSDSQSSRWCMSKEETRNRAAAAGVRVAPGRVFEGDHPPSAVELIGDLGEDLVVKPEDQGSSVGLHLIEGERELRELLDELPPGRWLAERRIRGREVSIGLLEGRAMGVVELLPKSGVYDYSSKYTSGATRYFFPAEIDLRLEEQVRKWAESVFACCGCRDFARADFMVDSAGEAVFLEINTIPGLTPNSLLPKSAACLGHTFEDLAVLLVEPAIKRFRQTMVPNRLS